MAFGLGVLRLCPPDFWAMTTRELAAAIEGVTGRARPAAPMTRVELSALMQGFPDRGADCQQPQVVTD